jgi:hypothetical protein
MMETKPRPLGIERVGEEDNKFVRNPDMLLIRVGGTRP